MAAPVAPAATAALGIADDHAPGGVTASRSGPRAPAELAADLELVWYDPEGLVPYAVDFVSREVEHIFEAVDRRIVLRRGSGFERPGRKPLRVILVRQAAAAWDLGDDVMGVAPGSSRPRRNIYIIAPTVREVIGQNPAAALEQDTPELAELALALARVLAHEIVHAVAPRHPHAEEGMMSPQQKRDSLLGEQFVLDDFCVKAFLRGLRRL